MPRVDSRKRQSQPNPATAERVEGPVATVSSRPPEEESWRAIGEGFSEGGGSKHSNSDPGVGAPAMSAGGSVAEGGGGAKAESRPPGPASWRADWQRAADGKKLMLHAGGGSGAGEKWRGGSA